MANINITFNETDVETNEKITESEAYVCEVVGNKVLYNDENNTKHEIIIGNEELRINSAGAYEVSNHYIAGANTEWSLDIKDQNVHYMLGIDTDILDIKNSDEKINIELKYALFEDHGVLSKHHIFIEVTK